MRRFTFSLSVFVLFCVGLAHPRQGGATPRPKYALSNLNTTIIYVIRRYLAPDRLNASKMFLSGMQSAAKYTPEIMVRLRGKTLQVRVGNHTLSVPATLSSPVFLMGAFRKVFTFLSAHLPKDVSLEKIENHAIRGMLETLDPHTNFLSPDVFKEMRIHHSGAFGGLGIVVSVCDGKLSVLKVLKGTPASRQKLQPGDHIVRIEGQPTENLSLSEAVKKLRGEPATPVAIEIARKGVRKNRRLSIMRESIAYDSVYQKILTEKESKIGYIKIKSFQIPTGGQVRKALISMNRAGVKGVILDLRNNGGGMLRAAIEVTNAFLDSGTIVAQVMKNLDENLRTARRANSRETLYRGPLVVLINGGSASASEIVAGTLKYSGRALVVGSRSFGKGSVQDVLPYPSRAALKITVAQYLTYGDVSIQGRGVEPDVQLKNVEIDPNNRGRKVIYHTEGHESTTEASLKSSLKAARKKRREKPLYNVFALATPLKEPPFKCRYCGLDPDTPVKRSLEEFVDDGAVALSKRLLLSWRGGTFTRSRALKTIHKAVATFAREQDVKIANTIKNTLRVDWRNGSKKSSNGRGKAEFRTSRPFFRTGRWAKMTLSFTNTSRHTLTRVRAQGVSTNPRLNLQELLFGRVKPGQKISKSFQIKVPKGVSTRADPVRFTFYSDKTPLGVTAKGKVVIQGTPLPRLSLSYAFRDENGDAMLRPGELGYFDVTVRNDGVGPTGEAKVILKNLTGSQVQMIRSRFDISNLKPGASKSMSFKVRALNTSGDLYWKFKLETTDCIFGNNISLPWYVRRLDTVPLHKLSRGGYVKVLSPSSLFDTPFVRSQIRRSTVRKGQILPITHELNNHYGIRLKSGERVYLPKVKGRPIKRGRRGLGQVPSFNYTPPKIQLQHEPHTARRRVTLQGSVKDADGVRDMYISVTNLKKQVFGVKEYYKLGKGATSLPFKATLPLYKGVNIVTISARDKHKATFSKNVVVLWGGN